MRMVDIPARLPVTDVLELVDIAQSKRCTVVEMIEEAVAQLIARERCVAKNDQAE